MSRQLASRPPHVFTSLAYSHQLSRYPLAGTLLPMWVPRSHTPSVQVASLTPLSRRQAKVACSSGSKYLLVSSSSCTRTRGRLTQFNFYSSYDYQHNASKCTTSSFPHPPSVGISSRVSYSHLVPQRHQRLTTSSDFVLILSTPSSSSSHYCSLRIRPLLSHATALSLRSSLHTLVSG